MVRFAHRRIDFYYFKIRPANYQPLYYIQLMNNYPIGLSLFHYFSLHGVKSIFTTSSIFCIAPPSPLRFCDTIKYYVLFMENSIQSAPQLGFTLASLRHINWWGYCCACLYWCLNKPRFNWKTDFELIVVIIYRESVPTMLVWFLLQDARYRLIFLDSNQTNLKKRKW